MQKIYLFYLGLALIILTSFGVSKIPSGAELTSEMFERTRQIETMRFQMRKLERIDGEMKEQLSFVKLQREPFKVYARQISPEEGIEVLYVEGERNNNALINPNGFPWVNVKLDPDGSIMRKEQHHTILDSGYDTVMEILQFLLNKYEGQADQLISNQGQIEWQGDSCWVIEMVNPHFKYIKYKVKPDEDLITIAHEKFLSEHMIMEHNDLDGYDDVEAGQIIEIPNDYSPKIVIYLDKELMLPKMMKIYDDKGLYEQYDYNNLEIDPSFASDEFTSSFTGYGF